MAPQAWRKRCDKHGRNAQTQLSRVIQLSAVHYSPKASYAGLAAAASRAATSSLG